jgi:hypothetical protein
VPSCNSCAWRRRGRFTAAAWRVTLVILQEPLDLFRGRGVFRVAAVTLRARFNDRHVGFTAWQCALNDPTALVDGHVHHHGVATRGDSVTLQSTYDTRTSHRTPSIVDGSRLWAAGRLVSPDADGH